MNFELNDEQRQLADSVSRFLADRYDFEARKNIIRSDGGMSEGIWQQLTELGILSLAFSEDVGGFGGGAIDLMSAMQSAGAALLVEPLLPNLLAGRLVDRLGTPAQRSDWLTPMMEGSHRLALATGEDATRYHLVPVSVHAVREGECWRLSGLKRVVWGAPQAHYLVVSATTEEGGTSLFVVPTASTGVCLSAYRTMCNQRAADVFFDDVVLGSEALLGELGQALAALEEAMDFGVALLCAEGVGAMQYAHETTLEYLKTRKQFGVALGTFQVLQHRMVDMVIATEQARSMCYLACSKVDGCTDPVERSRTVSAAKIKLADSARLVSQEAVQMHGGIGMTDELKISHTFRRLTMLAQQFGDADHHLERFAALDR
jgi:alkylation response protein AidB-like acyl-CoA dehydrogenase